MSTYQQIGEAKTLTQVPGEYHQRTFLECDWENLKRLVERIESPKRWMENLLWTLLGVAVGLLASGIVASGQPVPEGTKWGPLTGGIVGFVFFGSISCIGFAFAHRSSQNAIFGKEQVFEEMRQMEIRMQGTPVAMAPS